MPVQNQYQQSIKSCKYDLCMGYLLQDNFPASDMKDSFNDFTLTNTNSLEGDELGLFQYGYMPGYLNFRVKLANLIKSQAKRECDPEKLFVTNGISHGLGLVSQVFLSKNDLIFVEDRSYFIGIRILEDQGLNVQTIPINNTGLDIDYLKQKLTEGVIPKAIYIIPFNNNPAGCNYTENVKLELMRLSLEYNFLIISDDVYEFLHFNEEQVYKSMHSFGDPARNVISLGSFAKTVSPALRLGWIEADEHILTRIKSNPVIVSGGCVNPIMCRLMEKYLTDHFERNIQRTRKILKGRKDAMIDEIQKCFSEEITNDIVSYSDPNGGFFVWLKFSGDVFVTSDSFITYCREKYDLRFQLGFKCNVDKNYRDCLRLCFSFNSEETIRESIRALKNAYREHKSNRHLHINWWSGRKIHVFGHEGRLGSLIMKHSEELDREKYHVKPINRDLSEIDIEEGNIVIDVTSPEGLSNLVDKLNSSNTKNIILISGTTGDLPIDKLRQFSLNNKVIICSNFSRGVNMVKEFTNIINKYEEFKADILEIHHTHKKDNPSGTAKTLASKLDNIDNVVGFRAGNNFGEHKIILHGEGEKVEIVHQCLDRSIFAIGAIKLAENTRDASPGFVML